MAVLAAVLGYSDGVRINETSSTGKTQRRCCDITLKKDVNGIKHHQNKQTEQSESCNITWNRL